MQGYFNTWLFLLGNNFFKGLNKAYFKLFLKEGKMYL